MKLSSKPHEGTDSVSFSVYGVKTPGPSIKDQLNRLLQKKLLCMSLDALSTVLMKNPRFNLLPKDLSFLRDFESKWKQLEKDEPSEQDHERLYGFPSSAYDPIMILVFFRQNISGSGFFHRLHLTDSEDSVQAKEQVDVSDNSSLNTRGEQGEMKKGLHLRFDSREFALFYNNTPSQLDPDLQAVSTLTSAGKQFSTQTGTGIALIEIELLDKDRLPVDHVTVGASPEEEESILDVPRELISFSEPREQPHKPQFSLRIKVINTTLNLSVLHRWIKMTLDQALVGWVIERHLERSKGGLLRRYSRPPGSQSDAGPKPIDVQDSNEKKIAIDDICHGIPALQSMLALSYDLPHPAISKIELNTTLPALSLAPVTMDFLEGITATLFHDRKHNLVDFRGTTVIRISRGRRTEEGGGIYMAKSVSLSRDGATGNVSVLDVCSGTRAMLRDKPFDCPEYLCVFGLGLDEERGSRIEKRRLSAMPSSSALVFPEVIVDGLADDTDSLSSKLGLIKSVFPWVFSRSLSFVLSVTRSSRILYAYNCNPSTFST